MNDASGNEQFARLILALAPWLSQVVIIGGWAHRLYRLHPSAQQTEYPPLTTLDTDIAVPSRLESMDRDLREALIASGFEEERFGEHHPPATHYRLKTAKTGFYVEFLTPLLGAGQARAGKVKATLRVAGVVSQRLRYLDILLLSPWAVDLNRTNGFPLQGLMRVPIANPASFLAHKLLIHNKRKREKCAKDILYIHDTLEVFGARLGNLERVWRTEVKPRVPPATVKKILRAAKELFAQMSDAIRDAAQIVRERRLSAEAVRERCRFGLAQIFLEKLENAS